jgi:hypothetical protein
MMAISDRTFHREETRRKLQDIINHLEAASQAEAEGDFEKMEKEDQMAGMLMLVQQISGSSQLKEPKEGESKPEGFLAETMGKLQANKGESS